MSSSSAPVTASSAPSASSAPVPVPSASANAPASGDELADHGAAALVAECIERTWLGYTCNHAYEAAASKFPADAENIRAVMRLAVRAEVGREYTGGGEIASDCQIDKGQGAGYACLYRAESDPSAQKAAHALACKGAPAQAQLPIPGGSLACDGDRPVTLTALPKAEAEEVRRCIACGYDSKLTERSGLDGLADRKACEALRKRLSASQAAFVQASIEPLCPAGS